MPRNDPWNETKASPFNDSADGPVPKPSLLNLISKGGGMRLSSNYQDPHAEAMQ